MQKKNVVTSIICAAVFLFFLFQCGALSETAAYWPRMICIVGLALSTLEIALEGSKWYRTQNSQERLWALNLEQTKRGLILLGVLILWCLGLNTIGFLVTSLAALCAVALYFEPIKSRRHVIRDIAACLIIGVIVYVMFGYLGVHFPRALLI